MGQLTLFLSHFLYLPLTVKLGTVSLFIVISGAKDLEMDGKVCVCETRGGKENKNKEIEGECKCV